MVPVPPFLCERICLTHKKGITQRKSLKDSFTDLAKSPRHNGRKSGFS